MPWHNPITRVRVFYTISYRAALQPTCDSYVLYKTLYYIVASSPVAVIFFLIRKHHIIIVKYIL